MAMLINGMRVIETRYEFGVQWADDFGNETLPAATEDDAGKIADDTGGELVTRAVYLTDWVPAEGAHT